MRRIFGSKPARFERDDAVRLKTALPNQGLEPGTHGTIFEVGEDVPPSYEVVFANRNGVDELFVVKEGDLMPADGRRYDAAATVMLRRDMPSQGLTAGTVGTILGVMPGPPVTYFAEFVDADGATVETSLSDEDLSPADEAPERAAETPVEQGLGQQTGTTAETPEAIGLADEELDELIAELRSQGRSMKEAREAPQVDPPDQGDAEPPTPEPAEPLAQAPAEPPAQPAAAGGLTDDAPSSDGRKTRFIKGDAVRLDTDLPSAGFEAGAEGTVTWTILGPPVSYLVEFRAAGGGTSPPVKVEETYLSFAG